MSSGGRTGQLDTSSGLHALGLLCLGWRNILVVRLVFQRAWGSLVVETRFGELHAQPPDIKSGQSRKRYAYMSRNEGKCTASIAHHTERGHMAVLVSLWCLYHDDMVCSANAGVLEASPLPLCVNL
jgi:hypothetical protein